MSKKHIFNYSQEELEKNLEKGYQSKQIYNWIYKQYTHNFEDMNNIGKNLRQELADNYTFDGQEIIRKQESKDGSIKYLFKLKDSHTVETVLIQMKPADEKASPRYTICVSSQVGCKIGCKFCYTAKGGFVRNLEVGEIVYQVAKLKQDMNLEAHKAINIVFMGMGEPLDNFENVVQAIRIFSDKDGLNIAPARQTVSTSGISPKIEKLGELDLGINIAISLHAVDDELRTKLMPINKAYNIKSVISAVKKFPIHHRKRLMFEYLVIKGLNDDIQSAKKLLKLLDGIKAKVNLILFNSHEGSEFKKPDIKKVQAIRDYLNSKGLVCTIRESKGEDISAACGQLKEQHKNNTI